jgi:anthranilate phosphoribosyltransferase
MVLANAGAALLAAGRVVNIRDGVNVASETIDSGAAAAKLSELVAWTRDPTT